jgi:XTP/dITP diphosphohydrolase
MRIVLATGNKGKIKEIRDLLQDLDPDLQVSGMNEFSNLGPIPEPGETFQDNALYKARFVCRHSRLVSLADDSGLEVDALDGAPGIYSARFSGEKATDSDNNAKLLKAMAEFTGEHRRARFRCVLAACAPNGAELTVEGSWEGLIADTPRGEQGFGYDPLFIDLETGRTAAEMSRAEKSRRSHRGQALRKLVQLWPQFTARAQK